MSGAARRALALALAVLIALAVGPAAAGLHSNHLAVDAQISADGTVVIENGFASGEALVVLHADANGEPGEPVGVARFPRPGEFVSPITVPLDEEAWTALGGSRTLWAVLHNDADADGEYDPESDDALTTFGSVAGDRFVLANGEAPSYVVARGFGAQESADGTITVPRVALPEDGHLVVRAHGENGPGEIVGAMPLDAGVHEDVTVALDPSFFEERGERFALHAQAYTGGATDPGEPVTAGDATVGTKFFVSTSPGAGAGDDSAANGSDRTSANGTDGTVGTAGTATDDGPAVNTPEKPAVNTPTANASPSGNATASRTGADAPATSASGPGFGPGLPLAALLAAALVLARGDVRDP